MRRDIKEQLDNVKSYVEDENLEHFDILHMYPKGNASPNGYVDAKFFDLVAFDIESKKKRTYPGRDEVRFHGDDLVNFIRIFVDGSTMIKFNCKCEVMPNQSATVKKWVEPKVVKVKL